MLKIKFLSSEATLIEGESLETSGHGGRLPAGINIGNVVKTFSGKYSVKPSVDLNRITYISIITNFNLPQDANNDFDGFVEDQDRESEFENSTMGLQVDYFSPDGLWQHKLLISRAENDNTAFADGVKGNVTASTKDQYQFTGSRSFNSGAQTLSFLAEREEEEWMQRGAISWGIYDPNQDRERNNDSLAVSTV
mgnify:FL=1